MIHYGLASQRLLIIQFETNVLLATWESVWVFVVLKLISSKPWLNALKIRDFVKSVIVLKTKSNHKTPYIYTNDIVGISH
jgi:hypothetical protein